MILPRTAHRTGGLCMPCKTGNRELGNQAALNRKDTEPFKFAPNDEIEALRPFVDDFWSRVLETSYATSFVSNESNLDAWEHYAGGRQQLIDRVNDAYGIDITPYYDEPIAKILRRLKETSQEGTRRPS